MANTTIKKKKQGHNYKYADLASVNDYLEKNGITYYQYINRIEDADYVMTVPVVDGKELPPRMGCRVTQANLVNSNNPAQAQGSALTYARRYSLLMCFGLACEDDDGKAFDVEVRKINDTKVAIMEKKIAEEGVDIEKFLLLYGIKAIKDMNEQQFSDAANNWTKKVKALC